MDIALILKVFLAFIIGIISFMIFNTMIGGYFIPVFNTMVNQSDYMNYTTYQTQTNVIVSEFWIAVFIVVAIPILYLLVRLLRREPKPVEYGYTYGIG